MLKERIHRLRSCYVYETNIRSYLFCCAMVKMFMSSIPHVFLFHKNYRQVEVKPPS
jgi:hypothetical protein